VRTCASCGHENSDTARFCEECGAALDGAEPTPSREQRKTVTVLFCDVTGSTALGESTDPEALRALLARYFERMKQIVERHGGTVEKFIGDAVMAVFGVPVVHEDDALRAVRAAAEMRDALPELGVQARIGLTTGEVVTGTEERLATGDAVNVAARLEQAAPPGEVLLGRETLALVAQSVEVEALEPLALKGKAEPVPAYRLLAVGEEGPRAGHAAMVGRATELRRLRDAFEQAERNRSCQLFTILGSAGVGKSRLTAEFLEGLDATVIRGRCLSYGDGITYWPLVEALIQLGTRPEDTAAAATITAVLGETGQATTPDEIAWAFRKTIEQAAATRQLVCVFDDLHWAEPAFLDLVEHVADLSRDAPILLLCMARPELLDRRTGWGGGKLNATTVLLEPLSPAETEELIGRLGEMDEQLKARIREAAEGNPLFVEEMLAMVRESGGREVIVPPSIQALLAARLDQLDAAERTVLERGAVEGKVFHRGAVEALAPEEPRTPERLLALVRKELIRPDSSQIPGDDAFRFRHLLIRDAAYDALPKAVRADLHERFALWLEEYGVDIVELDEILGYHLEQAALYRAELGARDEEISGRAADRLRSAGRRAMLRDDFAAAAGLLSRSAQLLHAGSRDETMIELAEPLLLAGGWEELRSLTDELKASPDRRAHAYGLVFEVSLWQAVDPTLVVPRGSAAADEAEGVFIELGDERGLALVALARFDIEWMQSQSVSGHAAIRAMREHALRSGDPVVLRRALARGYGVLMFGYVPADEALRESEELVQMADASLQTRAASLVVRGFSLGLQGRFAEGLELMAEERRVLQELGNRVSYASNAHSMCVIKLFAGDARGAVDDLRDSVRDLGQLGEQGFRSTSLGYLAIALHAAGEPEEAERAAFESEDISAPDDYVNFALGRTARALVLADRGELTEAEQVARSAVEYAFRTDFPLTRADALAALSRALLASGREDEAEEELRRAVELYRAKGADACLHRLSEIAGAPLPAE
jgi:class 3 adenylate cyclase/tetratricopeptide (TPR) repeat protein